MKISYLEEELIWKIHVISLAPKAAFTLKIVCYVIYRNGLETFWSNHVYSDQVAPKLYLGPH